MLNSMEKLKKIRLGICVGLLCAFFASPALAKVLAADLVAAPESLLPYFSWLADENEEFNIRTVSAEAVQDRFAPLAGGIPLRGAGPVWLRLDISRGQQSGMSAPPAARNRLVMRLGQLPPGGAEVFSPEAAGFSTPVNWRSERVNSMEEALLPEPGLSPMRVYIRLQEMPGLWFSPRVSQRTAAGPDILPSELLLPGIIIAALLACFLRAIAEQSQWALWAALFLGCVLAQSRLPMPLLGRTPIPADLPSLLAPGLSLILLPHVGRRIFYAGGNSLWKNSIFYLCSALGAAVALVPILSGQLWLARLFPLWPLLLVPLLPVCVSALTARQPGSLAFSGAVVMPVLGSVLALFALKFPDIHPFAAQGSLWGLAVGGLGLALARIPKWVRQRGSEPAISLAEAGGAESFSTLSAQSQYDELPPLEVTRTGAPEAGADIPALPAGDSGGGDEEGPHTEKWEKGVWTRTGDGLSEYPGFSSGKDAEAGISSGEASPGGDDAELPPEVLSALRGESGVSAFVFNLHSMVRELHEMVLPLARSRGLILSWYIAPVCPALLEGDAPRLRGALALLLQNAVRACVEGVVQLSVRPAPGGEGQGDLLFTISDSGAAKHTDAGFFLAWELSARSGGAFTVDYSPQSGTRIAFTARFAVPSEDAAQTSALLPALEDEEDFAKPEQFLPDGVLGGVGEGGSGAGRIARAGQEHEEAGRVDGADPVRAGFGAGTDAPLVLLADMTNQSRRRIAGYLWDFLLENLEEGDTGQIRRMLREKTAALLIFDADMPEADIVKSISSLRAEEKELGLDPLPVLVIAGHRAQAERLLKAGASHALGKPFTRQSLREQVGAALPAHATPGAAPGRGQRQPAPPPVPEVQDAPAPQAAPEAREAPGAPVLLAAHEAPDMPAAPRETWTNSYEEERAKVWESSPVRAAPGQDLRGSDFAAEETQAAHAGQTGVGGSWTEREPWSEESPITEERRAFVDPSIHDLFLDPSIAFMHPGQLAPFPTPRHSTAPTEEDAFPHGADAPMPASGQAAPMPGAAGAESVAASEADEASRPRDAKDESADPQADAPQKRKADNKVAPGHSLGPKIKLTPARLLRPSPDAPEAGAAEAGAPGGKAALQPQPGKAAIHQAPKVKLTPTKLRHPAVGEPGAFGAARAAGLETGASSSVAPVSDAKGSGTADSALSPDAPLAAPILREGPKVKLPPSRPPRPLPDDTGAFGAARAADDETGAVSSDAPKAASPVQIQDALSKDDTPAPKAPDAQKPPAALSPAKPSAPVSLTSGPDAPVAPVASPRTAAALFQKLRRTIETQSGVSPLSEAKAAGASAGGAAALRKPKRNDAPLPDAKTASPSATIPEVVSPAILPPQDKEANIPLTEKPREASAPVSAAASSVLSPASYMSTDLETSAWTRSYPAASTSAPASPQTDASATPLTDALEVSTSKTKVAPTRLPRHYDAGGNGGSAPHTREDPAVAGQSAPSIFYTPEDLETSAWTRSYAGSASTASATPRSDVSTLDRSGVPADPKVKLPPTRLPRKPMEDSDIFGAKTQDEAASSAASDLVSVMEAGNRGAAPMIMGLSVDDVTPPKDSSGAEQDGGTSATGGADKFDGWLQPHMRPAGQLRQEPSTLSAIARTIVAEDQPLFVLDDIREIGAEADKSRVEGGALSGRRRPNPGSLLDFVLAPEDADKEKADEDATAADRRDFSVTPVPGIEGEHIESAAIPLIPGLVEAIGEALRDAAGGLSENQTVLAQEAASRLAGRAESFGLTKLGRLSRCLERAAEADDAEAAVVLLEELQLVARRYQSALQECFNSFIHYRH
ncbi:MAG: hypothetical protein LBS65_04235 [Desulfovibrio sp.]|jgi:CheY-like chemotaxis protein/HPt (histidine-containing phosphotransfer) domain-containing protein|nr:hypothetical protein [Desulfovibrio sp.]